MKGGRGKAHDCPCKTAHVRTKARPQTRLSEGCSALASVVVVVVCCKYIINLFLLLTVV